MAIDAARAKKIRQRTLVGAGLVCALVALFWLASFDFGPRLVAGLALVIACVGAWEGSRMGLPWDRKHPWPLWLGVLLAQGIWLVALDPVLGLYADVAPDFRNYFSVAMLATGLPILVAYIVLRVRTHGQERARSGWAGLIATSWLILPLAFLYPVRLLGDSVHALIALVILSKVGDIAGYYVGNLCGKSHPFPNLSPGKTTAGCVGSFIAGVSAGIGCQYWGLLPSSSISGVSPSVLAAFPGLWAGAFAGASINVAAQAGDLFESYWKRKTSVKDSGAWFGPSGGMLDLTDSLQMTAPLAALTWPWLFYSKVIFH